MRRILACLLLLCNLPATANEPAPVVPGFSLVFPRDHGAHPDFRTEWWYITGQVTTEQGETLGFQITFFRSRTGIGADSKSPFAPRQLIFAHAAIADPAYGKLRHDQKAARAMPGIAQAEGGDTDVQLETWTLKRKEGRYLAVIPAKDFKLELDITPTREPLLQGANGFSQKGAATNFSSYYYSLPQLKVGGTVEVAGKPQRVSGTAWLDHEWSSEVLMPGAQGWDWVGLNLDDGGAVMAFRIRDKAGKSLWAGGSWRKADGSTQNLAPADVSFTANRTWRSPRTGAVYPVDANIRTGSVTWHVKPMMADQELDSRASTGAVYWEGAVTVSRDGKRVGAGYLEMTGYTERIRF